MQQPSSIYNTIMQPIRLPKETSLVRSAYLHDYPARFNKIEEAIKAKMAPWIRFR